MKLSRWLGGLRPFGRPSNRCACAEAATPRLSECTTTSALRAESSATLLQVQPVSRSRRRDTEYERRGVESSGAGQRSCGLLGWCVPTRPMAAPTRPQPLTTGTAALHHHVGTGMQTGHRGARCARAAEGQGRGVFAAGQLWSELRVFSAEGLLYIHPAPDIVPALYDTDNCRVALILPFQGTRSKLLSSRASICLPVARCTTSKTFSKGKR